MGGRRDHAGSSASLVVAPVIRSSRVSVDDTNCSGSLNSWPHSHTEWIPKWTTYSDFSQVRSSRLQAAPLGSRCWNGCDSQKWEFRFHRLAILLTFRETVDYKWDVRYE